MSNFEKLIYFIIFFVSLLGVYFAHTDLKYYESVYAMEDGPVEWLTVVSLAYCMGLMFYRSKILAPFRSRLFVWSLRFYGLVFIFGIGEEISWGQRIFKIKSPVFFINHNTQMEMNIHNLILGGVRINKFFFGTILGIVVAIYFLLLPYLYKKKEKIRDWVDAFAIPIPKMHHLLAYLLLALCVEMIPGGKKGEILEFGGCWIFALMAWRPYNRPLFSRRLTYH